MTYQLFLWVDYASFLLLLLCAILAFLCRGWQNRRREILNGFSGASARIYLESFQPSAPKRRRKPWTLRSYEEMAPLERLDYYYHAEFSRWRFIMPFGLLIFVIATSMLWCVTTVSGWFASDSVARQSASAMLPIESVFAILGGYMWVAYYLVERCSRERLLPSDLYWGSFRMIIVVPLAYAISQAFRDALAIPLSFFLGTFPTETVMTFGRRFAAKQLGAADGDEKPDRMLSLPSVDRPIYETLAAEGITNLYTLAYCDPVKVTFRTGLDFSYVLVAASQALAYIYFRDKADIAVRYGLDGAGECRNLWDNLTSENPSEAQEATAILASLKDALALPEEACKNLIREIAEDPFTEFHFQCWLDRAERVRTANAEQTKAAQRGLAVTTASDTNDSPSGGNRRETIVTVNESPQHGHGTDHEQRQPG